MMKYETVEKFIPTIAEWGKLYNDWASKIAKSLWNWGSKSDALDATQEAFLKIMGLSKKYRLEKPLEPMSVGAWYAHVRQQAKWILCHENEKARYWRAKANTMDELIRELDEADEDTKCRGRRLMGLLVDLEGREMEAEIPGDRLDAEWLWRKVLKWIATVNAAARSGAMDREIESMDEYAAIWQWYGENTDWQLMEELVDGRYYRGIRKAFRGRPTRGTA